MHKCFIVLGSLLLVTSCSLLNRTPQIDDRFQDQNSKIIPLLITSDELAAISKDFAWMSIMSEQEQYPQSLGTPRPVELASRMYRGTDMTSDSYITIWHTITKYGQPIDIGEPPLLEFGVAEEDVTDRYSPQIDTSGIVISDCLVYRAAGQSCKVEITYRYIESNLYLSTEKLYQEETLSEWLNAIVAFVEPRILSQDILE
jgi:hypothetical protein